MTGDESGLVSIINPESGLVMRVISDHKGSDGGVTALHFSSLTPRWLISTADRRTSVWQSDWVSANQLWNIILALTE